MVRNSEIQRLSRRLGIVCLALFFSAAAIICIGLSTYLWSPADAEILEGGNVHHSGGALNMAPEGRLGQFGGSFDIGLAKYIYSVKGGSYESSLVCICIPIGIDIPAAGKRVKIYHVPFWPQVSVMKRGPHFILVSILLLFGAFLWVIKRKLDRLPDPGRQ